ncbi:hypothetical protein [Streptomyces sp. NBC_00847]|uniref:hypothetical protein n=1 Tax=Streptomyces sp. NBC_00847 TaxID=2975850 RepID=UPI00225E2F9A|nr:hypothetical protein [Streptomyces sp. NBC_00847]MCX4885868.1 hypothetical protein [Streptomyces sp. NBC_00847]
MMDSAVKAWLIAQLGTSTDQTDLEARYTRLGTARAVALEVLRERYAALRDQPTAVSVSSVVLVNYTANLAAYERQIALLEAGTPPAPDDPPATDTDTIGLVYLHARPRR